MKIEIKKVDREIESKDTEPETLGIELIPEDKEDHKILERFWEGDIKLTGYSSNGKMLLTFADLIQSEKMKEERKPIEITCGGCGKKLLAKTSEEIMVVGMNHLEQSHKKAYYEIIANIVKVLAYPLDIPMKISLRLGDLKLDYIITKRRELKLRGSINVSVVLKEDGWVFEYPELNIISCGETDDDTLESFQEDFIELFEHYVLGDPKKMTGNALRIRKIFETLVVQ